MPCIYALNEYLRREENSVWKQVQQQQLPILSLSVVSYGVC